MIRKMGYRWNLRKLMAQKDLFQTTELVPLLAERGIHLSREQVYRLVTQPPQRLSMDTFVALCDILDCTPNDLIEVEVTNAQVSKAAGGSVRAASAPTDPANGRSADRPTHEVDPGKRPIIVEAAAMRVVAAVPTVDARRCA